MVFRTTPQLGPQIDDVFKGLPYWDMTGVTEPSYRLGDRETGSDGHDYIWVKASAAIPAAAGNGTQVVITEPGYTVAPGNGGWYSYPGVAIASGDYFHARKGALGAM